MRDGGQVIFNIALGFLLDLGVFGNQIQGLILLEYLHTHFLSVTLLETAYILLFYFDKLADLYFLICYFMIEDADYLGDILVSLLDGLILLASFFKLFLQLKYLHFQADYIVILIGYYFLDSSHIDIGLLGQAARLAFIQVPRVDLSLHFSILFFDIPDPGFERAIFFFDVIDDALVIIILVPDEVLGCHVAIEVDAGLEDIVIGVDFFPQLLLIFDAAVQQALLGFELFVVAAEDEQRRVIKIFHREKNIIIPSTLTLSKR